MLSLVVRHSLSLYAGIKRLNATLMSLSSQTELMDEEAEENSMHWCKFKGK